MGNSWVFKKENLFIRIAIGFAIGILLGLFAPGFSISTRIVGDLYLRLIKFMVLPVLVCAVMTGIINSANIKSLRRVAVKTVVLFFVMFLASFAVSSVVATSIRPGQGIVFENQPVYEGTIAGKLSAADVLRQLFPSSLEDIFSSKNILVTIILAIILAVVIVRMGEKAEPVRDFINRLSDIVFRILSVIMETSPIGVMSLIAFSIAEYGAGLFMAIGKYILCCWLACMAVFIIVFMLPVILLLTLSQIFHLVADHSESMGYAQDTHRIEAPCLFTKGYTVPLHLHPDENCPCLFRLVNPHLTWL